MAENFEKKNELEEFDEDFVEEDSLNEETSFDEELKSGSLAETPPAKEEDMSKSASPLSNPVEEQERPYSRLGGPLFISLPKYRELGKRIFSMKNKISRLKNELVEIKEIRNKSTKNFTDILDNLEVVEENIREINGVLKVKS